MGKKLHKLFALFGAIALLLAMLPSAPARAWEDPPALCVEVSPARSIYTPLSSIEFVVTVTNISGGLVNNIKAYTTPGQDLYGSPATATRASLIPNQSFTFSYKARLRALKSLDVLLYPLMWLRGLIFPFAADDTAISEEDMRGYYATASAKLLAMGSYDVSTQVFVHCDDPVPYEPDPNDPGLTAEQEKELALKLLTYKMDENGIFYVAHERWTKTSGFNQIYNLSNPLIQLVYGTVAVKFQYGNKDWLVRLWKGRYGLVMLGGEIGVFNKPADQVEERYYSASADEELVMAMEVYQHNFSKNQTKHLFTRGPESAWWFNGFVPGSFHEYNKKPEIIIVGTIQFPGEEMLQAFEAAFAAAGFVQGSPTRDNPETYVTSGNSLKFCWQYLDQGA